MAKVAMAAGNSHAANAHLCQAISLVRDAQLPLAAWRVYAAAANFCESRGESENAAKYQGRSDQIVRSLANSLEPNDPLRSVAFLASAEISGSHNGNLDGGS